MLGRSPSTISRESARNSTRGRPYRACTAQTLAGARAYQPRRSRKLVDPWLWQYVQTQLMQKTKRVGNLFSPWRYTLGVPENKGVGNLF
ncbi:MAG: hypothetical protein H7Y39_00655 [Nitrospiraceae bacterium]|nr:hypothetical protein [Nitrospiraceae bacterium]